MKKETLEQENKRLKLWLMEFYECDEILEREVKKFGNSAHIPVPSKHIGKKVKVLIKFKRRINKRV